MGIFSKKHDKSHQSSEQILVVSEKTSFAVREAYKSLRTNLIFSCSDPGSKKILITSTTKNEGKSTVAVNLSKTLAENGSKVLLLDCDLRLSYLARALKVHREKGLTDVIVGAIPLAQGVIRLRDNLDFLPAGTVPPNPSELLGSARMERIVKELERHYDYILFDAPPIGIVADPLVLSPLVSGFIMVVRKDVAKKEEVDRCIREMQRAGTRMFGFILSAADGPRGSKGKYSRYSNYVRYEREYANRKS